MSESFTREELETAASRLGHILSMRKILDAAALDGNKPWTEERLRYWLGHGCQWLSEVTAEARRLHQPPIANDEDELTVGELRAAIRRDRATTLSVTTADAVTDRLMADIRAHREPEYPEGTVVEDADGTRWKRSKYGWMQGAYIWGPAVRDDSVPARPLTVIS